MNDFQLSPEDLRLIREAAEARAEEANVRDRSASGGTTGSQGPNPTGPPPVPVQGLRGMTTMTTRPRASDFSNNLAQGGPRRPRRTLGSWLVIWLLGLLGLGSLLTVLR